MSILKYHPHRRLRHNSPNSLFPPAVSPDTAVFLLSKKELLQCLMKTKSVFCMFSRANIRKNGLLQMSCAPFSSLLLGSGLYFFRPQSPRKNAHSLLRYFGIRGICITSLPAARFANLLLKIEKRPTSPELFAFGAILDVFIWYGFTVVGKPAICFFVAIEKRHIAAALLLCPEDGTGAVQLSVVPLICFP